MIRTNTIKRAMSAFLFEEKAYSSRKLKCICICGKQLEYEFDEKGWPYLRAIQIFDDIKATNEIFWCGLENCKTLITLMNIAE